MASINEKAKHLDEILLKSKILDNLYYKKWYNTFKLIYGKKNTNLELYILFSIIYFVGHIFISKFILNDKKDVFPNNKNLEIFKDIQDRTKDKFNNLNVFTFEFFLPFFSLKKKEDLSLFHSLIHEVSNHIFNLEIEPEYIFDFLIQNIISPMFRHKSGEYYTPPFLVKKMVKEAYIFGESVLDPCCGSGNFLIEIIKKIISSNNAKKERILALNNIFGYDINPLSIFVAKINFLFLLKDFIPNINLNLFVADSLFKKGNLPNKRFDLIIGNPPWYTFRAIESLNYQENIKSLAEKLGIKPRPKNILNIEISSLFFYQARDLYMRVNAKIFFVITKEVITGSHTSRFRSFNGFKNVKIWKFDKKIEKIFNIDFICLFAQKSDLFLRESKIEIPAHHFTLKIGINDVNYFDNVELKLKKIDLLVPYAIEMKGNKTYVKKLVSKEQKRELIPTKESYYKKLFHKGADLNPRNLIFVNFEKINESLVKIIPEEKIFKRAKSPWNKKEYKSEFVEKKYIFNVIKSTELVKFYVYDDYYAFLPLLREDLSFNYNNLSENARNFYDKINNIYINNKKDTTKNKSLMDNLNRWSKLINDRQKSKIKVVYNNSGSTLNAAVIVGNFLVTGDLSFYSTNNINEAHYLAAILNSPIITKQVQIKKSSRHIFKIPLDIPIKKFTKSNLNHRKLTELGKKGQYIAKSVINEMLEFKKVQLSKFKIQNILSKKLSSILTHINDICYLELRSSN